MSTYIYVVSFKIGIREMPTFFRTEVVFGERRQWDGGRLIHQSNLYFYFNNVLSKYGIFLYIRLKMWVMCTWVLVIFVETG